VLNRLSKVATVYLLCTANDDEEERRTREAVLLTVPDFPRHHVLFYGSEVGRTAILRQVSPSVHVDDDITFCTKLKPHLKRIVLLGSSSPHHEVTVNRSTWVGSTVDGADGERCNSGSDRTLPGTTGCANKCDNHQNFPSISTIGELLELSLA
jgi:hypothetical protein